MPVTARVIGDGPVSAGCTLIDMTAEGSSATALDGCQHFQMQAVQPVPVPVDKMPSCQTNHVGHLQRWPGHLLVCRGALETQRIERTGCGVQLLGGDMQVDGCLLQIAVAQQQLNRPQVRTGFEQMRGEAVPQGVRMDVFLQARSFCSDFNCDPDDLVVDVVVGTVIGASGKQPDLGLAPQPAVICTELLEQCWAEHYITIFASLAAFHVNDHALAV